MKVVLSIIALTAPAFAYVTSSQLRKGQTFSSGEVDDVSLLASSVAEEIPPTGEANKEVDEAPFFTEPNNEAAIAIAHRSKENFPGALEPMGVWDPWGFIEKSSVNQLIKFREAEVTHGRISMLAVVGFLTGENVAGHAPLFSNWQVSGPAITHFGQVPGSFWSILGLVLSAAEVKRIEAAYKPAEMVPVEGLPKLKNVRLMNYDTSAYRENYVPGDIKFDPAGLKPKDPEEYKEMITKELQHGRLAMLGVAGFIAQELVDGKGIWEHFQKF